MAHYALISSHEKNTKIYRWQKETLADYVDPTPPLNPSDPPTYIPPDVPDNIDIPGKWQKADAAWLPMFKAKPSVGFTPQEHPDRPTLLSELAGMLSLDLPSTLILY